MKCLNYVVNVDLNPCKNVKQMIPNATISPIDDIVNIG